MSRRGHTYQILRDLLSPASDSNFAIDGEGVIVGRVTKIYERRTFAVELLRACADQYFQSRRDVIILYEHPDHPGLDYFDEQTLSILNELLLNKVVQITVRSIADRVVYGKIELARIPIKSDK